ncbi:MAG: THUMP domain-containing protein, partial [Rhodocyclaceae bacterium]|nr:THUMP domain-containing protein [Rhodocyclaceae bacterium]
MNAPTSNPPLIDKCGQRRLSRQPGAARAARLPGAPRGESFFATCPRGLEALLAEDIVAAGGQQLATTPGGAGFTGNWETCYRVNLESRIATRVLWRVANAEFRNEADIYQLALDVAWPKLFKVDHSIRVYVTAVRAPFKSIEYITLKVKDAVCDRFRADTGKRPDVNTAAPEVRIHLFVTEKTA